MNDQELDQLLHKLAQPEPSAALDNHIKNAVEKQLALENHYRAEWLLNSQSTRLDETTKSNLINAMSEQRKLYGPSFDQDYSYYVTQQNDTQAGKDSDTPELGLE